MARYSDEELKKIWEQSEKRCIYGEQKPVKLEEYGTTWQVEHANPDGVDDLRNWRVSCIRHNLMKSTKTRQEFEQFLRGQKSSLGDYKCGVKVRI